MVALSQVLHDLVNSVCDVSYSDREKLLEVSLASCGPRCSEIVLAISYPGLKFYINHLVV